MLARMCVYLCGDHMIEVAGEGSGQPEDVVILLSGVPQGLDLAIQLHIHSLVCLAQPLVQTLPAALVGGDGPLLDARQLVHPRAGSGHCWTRAWNRTGVL